MSQFLLRVAEPHIGHDPMPTCGRRIGDHHHDNKFTAFHIRKPVGKQ